MIHDVLRTRCGFGCNSQLFACQRRAVGPCSCRGQRLGANKHDRYDQSDAVQEHSNWPTYPQLYVGGELLGGCDIVLEMAADGELKQVLACVSSQEVLSSCRPD